MKRWCVYVLIAVLLTPHVGNAAQESLHEEVTQLRALVSYLERALNRVPELPLTAKEMRAIVYSGTEFLVNAQEPSGHFAYEYAPYEGVYREDDNIVRQTGAFFQLGEVVRRTGGTTLNIENTMESAIAYFESLSRADSYNGRSFRCIVEDEESIRCKLGATSLALVGVLSYVDAYPDKRVEYEDLITDYVEFIKALKIDDGGFRNIYRVGQEFQRTNESSFSNGEAMLALVRYHQYESDQEAALLAQEMFTYLKETPFDTPLYLWIMAALKDMQELWPNDAYATYTRAYTDWRVRGVSFRRGTQHNYCAYSEGIVSAYSILEGSESTESLAALRTEIDYWNNKNGLLQIRDGEQVRFVMEDGSLVKREIQDIDQAHGGFLTGHVQDELYQRIDFTQHCISAYLQTLVDIDGQSL